MIELSQIRKDGYIDDEQEKKIKTYEANKLFSIHWELRIILYLGILLFTTGIGRLVYLHIDTIGHQAVLAIIALACGGCFYYINKHKQPYSNEQIKNSMLFFDYIVLLACLLFAVFIGYLQYQYKPMGYYYNIVILIPSLFFFYIAYRFDHKGVLSMAIMGLAGTFRLSVAPLQLLEHNDFSSLNLIFTALFFALLMLIWALYADLKNIKMHFSFSYNNFAANILFIATLAALFGHNLKLISFLFLAGLCVYFIRYAIKKHSYLFLLLSVLYGYIGLSYFLASLFPDNDIFNVVMVLFFFLYTILSCVGLVFFFINIKKILKIKNDSL